MAPLDGRLSTSTADTDDDAEQKMADFLDLDPETMPSTGSPLSVTVARELNNLLLGDEEEAETIEDSVVSVSTPKGKSKIEILCASKVFKTK